MATLANYMMNRSEQTASDFFAERGLRAERFSKEELRAESKKTPDFRVYRNDTFQFYCEVKETTDADPLEDHMVEVHPGLYLGTQCKIGDISRHSRFANRIRGAVEQFDSVNPDLEHPNVLVFVNSDEMCVPSMLEEVLRGYLVKSQGHPIKSCPSSVIQRAQTHGVRVHLFIWLNQIKGQVPVWFFPWDRADAPMSTLRELFPEARN
jgi:hypothetical protein